MLKAVFGFVEEVKTNLQLSKSSRLPSFYSPPSFSMLQISDLPRFQGNESPQEAEKWLETLIINTGSFSDAGIFRLLTNKFPPGSRARQWFDELDEKYRGKWTAFEQQFRSRWIAEAAREAERAAAWQKFTQHVLTLEAIFSEDTSDRLDSKRKISSWVQDHRHLAAQTHCDDSTLIKTTDQLLPPFIYIYLQVYFKPQLTQFDQYCQAISDIPFKVVESERIRRQISPKDRIATIEKRIEEMSEQIEKLLIALHHSNLAITDTTEVPSAVHEMASIPTGTAPGGTDGESISWEPCSPVTSVEPLAKDSAAAPSELSTPVAQPIPLTDTWDGTGENNSSKMDGPGEEQILLYSIPSTWRKPAVSMKKNDLISITQRAIKFLFTFNPELTLDQGYTLQTATTIFDRLTSFCENEMPSRRVWSTSSSDHSSLLSGLLDIHRYNIYEAKSYLNIPSETWSNITASNSCNRKGVVKLDQTEFRDGYGSSNLHTKESGEPSVAGGMFRLSGSGLYIESTRTVLFMTLSSYLAECTGLRVYKDTALASANCIKTWMLDSATTLVKDGLIDPFTAEQQDGWTLSFYLTGLVIEGFSVLASVTNDESWRTLALEISMAAMRYDEWHDYNRILSVACIEDPSKNTTERGFKGLLNRGLLVAYERNRSNKLFCNYVRSYINVQLNALLDLARHKNSYGVDWRGPYTGPYAHAQLAAIDTFVAAVGVNDLL